MKSGLVRNEQAGEGKVRFWWEIGHGSSMGIVGHAKKPNPNFLEML
jgi:hypothetical protein